MTFSEYLGNDQELRVGSVDDYGDAKYLRLEQNVPDGHVYDLQTDLLAMGFNILEEADGAFGELTGKAVKQFQRLAKVAANGVVDHITKNEIRTWLTHGHTKQSPPPSEAPSTPTTENGVTLISPRVPHFSQGDSRWSSRILGNRSTIQRKGCAITSVAMILKFFGRNVTPGTLDAYLDQEGGYSGDSVVWDIAGRHDQARRTKLKYFRENGSQEQLHAHLKERVHQNLPTLVRVDYGVDQDIRYNHFVVCVGKTDQGQFVMNDPATRLGDGYADPCDDNIIQKTTRKNGYKIVQLDWYDKEA